MSKIVVQGGRRLTGKVRINGAKNAVLPIIAASILAERGQSVIQDVPPLEDVRTMKKTLESLGVSVSLSGEALSVSAGDIREIEPAAESVRKMRASFLVSGPLLARNGRFRIAFPGGCDIGTRAIDQHIKGFEAMGAKIEIGKGYIDAETKGRLKGAKIYLDVPSVGATENIMMAASLAEGTTVIENAAREPEIVDLANFLNAMGGKIRGAGTGTIRIEGVRSLQGAVHTVIPDRIEAGTYMIAAAITKGDLFVEGAIADHLRSIISKLQEMGVVIEEEETGLRVKTEGKLRSVDIKTLPHPGFPTDLQSQMMALLLTADGTGVVTETVFENRFRHVEEFKKMKAQIIVDGITAIVKGNAALVGANVRATDLRAGAALILAGLVAEGQTEIDEVHHIDRGYSDIVEKLRGVGADICRREESEPVTDESVAEKGVFTIQPSWA